MTTGARVLAATVACAGALALTALVTFVAVVFLAGPHAGLLPSWLEAVVLALGWIMVLVVPALVARRVWRASNTRTEEGGHGDSDRAAGKPQGPG